MSRRAVILAGGRGTRLRPYTIVLPKPLVPVGEFPILEIIIRQLVAAGFDHITLAVNHQAEIIKAFFQSGERWGVNIDYSLEDRPLGTMGPLKQLTDLPDCFLVMNGDILTDLNFAEFYLNHTRRNEIFTICSKQRIEQTDYGVLEISDTEHLLEFREKPQVRHQVSMGVYMLSLKVLDYIPENCSYGFDHLMSDLLASHQSVKVDNFEGYWLDIGRPDDYEVAIKVFENERSKFLCGI